jgi:acetolactate synthase I/II/III large subunit
MTATVETMYTTSAAFLEALQEAGVSHIFANFGSDHPALIEALAEMRATGRTKLNVITCPNEMVALSAAHGFAQATGRAQAVFVHVECGTQALAGAIHNAAKGRIPVLIFAGASPFTQEGELRGSRNEFIHWIQDVFDQRGIVRGYMKYDNEIRTGVNVKQLVFRALQFAHSDPKGPVYLMGPREVMEQEAAVARIDPAQWPPLAPGAIPPADIANLVEDLVAARRPLIVTSYLGRNPEAVAELVRLAERVGVGVLESVANYVNFPTDHFLHQGSQGNEPVQNPVVDEADVVLVIDSDVPWIPMINKPAAHAKIRHIDVDPLKQQMPLWYIHSTRAFRADAATALRQINDRLDHVTLDPSAVQARAAHYSSLHEKRGKKLQEREHPIGDAITPEYLTASVRRHLDDDTIVLNEGITNYTAIADHLGATRPGSMLTSGGGSLGWNGGAAIGVKLAHPAKTVVCLTGDGSYLFSVPSSVHWIARRYGTPFLQIIYNNGGWKAPKLSMLAVHPAGYGSQASDIDVSFDPASDYGGIAAAAGGAFAREVLRSGDLDAALTEAFRVVRQEHRCAVLDVRLPHL